MGGRIYLRHASRRVAGRSGSLIGHLRLRRERVEDRTARIRHRHVRRRLFVVVVVGRLRRHELRRRELRLRKGRRGCRGGDRRARRRARRHHHDAIVLRQVGGGLRPRGRHVAAERAKQHVERLGFGNVVQLERERPARDAIQIDDCGLPDAGPLSKDLADRCIARDQRHAAILNRKLNFGESGRAGGQPGCRTPSGDFHLIHRT